MCFRFFGGGRSESGSDSGNTEFKQGEKRCMHPVTSVHIAGHSCIGGLG